MGRQVFFAAFTGPSYRWNGQGSNGNTLASRVYFVRVLFADNQNKISSNVFKLMVIR